MTGPGFIFSPGTSYAVGSRPLEAMIRAVEVIPASGENAYDTVVQTRATDPGLGVQSPYSAIVPPPPAQDDPKENDAEGRGNANWTNAMDDLSAALPEVSTVFLAVGWFGSDLRCATCAVQPKVETASKITSPDSWAVHGIDRETAAVVSQTSGRANYGGTPSDKSLVRAILDLHERGLSVVLNPFIFMDVPSGNVLPNPYSADGASLGQSVFPWRGRITCHPAPGQVGTVDKTPAATGQVAAFFGDATPAQIAVSIDPDTFDVTTTYTGPAQWGLRRFILHYAKLCAAINALAPGAVTGFLIGSELVALNQVRSSALVFPAVDRLVTLAQDVKTILGTSVLVSYGADWSEYSGYRPADGSGDLFFHLDPLWSDASVGFVGIDWYLPMSDWRDGTAHLDYLAGHTSIYDTSYLQANIEAGEYFDWFYASGGDRTAQTRTAITDGAYGEPWVYRAKDLRSFWLNQHFDRPDGVRSLSPTGWVPQSKPIWLTEFGIPSIDKATNQPNVFYDPRSSESAFPYFSGGTRDDAIQRAGIEAFLGWWDTDAGRNPTSTVYGGPMIGNVAVWTWDARPFPFWPDERGLWSDGDLHDLGHWLEGKVGFVKRAYQVDEDDFARIRTRRIPYDQAPGDLFPIEKRGAELLDVSVDLSFALGPDEEVTEAFAWSNLPFDLPVTSAGFARKGCFAFIQGGTEGLVAQISIQAATSRGKTLLYRAEVTVTGEAEEASTLFSQPQMGRDTDPSQHYLVDVNGDFVAPSWVDENGDLLTPDYGAA